MKHMKETAELGITVWSIPFEELMWVSVSDASLHNSSEGGSQGAYAILATTTAIGRGERQPASLLAWRSSRMNRVVDSTLHAETLSLNTGVAELGWLSRCAMSSRSLVSDLTSGSGGASR